MNSLISVKNKYQFPFELINTFVLVDIEYLLEREREREREREMSRLLSYIKLRAHVIYK